MGFPARCLARRFLRLAEQAAQGQAQALGAQVRQSFVRSDAPMALGACGVMYWSWVSRAGLHRIERPMREPALAGTAQAARLAQGPGRALRGGRLHLYLDGRELVRGCGVRPVLAAHRGLESVDSKPAR